MTSSIILDSGAYSAWSKGVKIDIDQYIEFIKTHKDTFQGGALNLDVIGDAKRSYENWKYMRAAGVDTIPVFHISRIGGDDEKYLQKYLKQTDYIAIGAMANLDMKARTLGLDWIWKDYLMDEKRNPKVRVHGLGLTAMSMILKYPWYSVDSSTATKTAMFGKIHVPELRYSAQEKRYIPDHSRIFAMIVSDQGNHDVSNSRSLFSMTPIMREGYTQLIEERGYTIGDISKRVFKTTRRNKRLYKDAKNREAITQPSFNLLTDNDKDTTHRETDVTHSWHQRCLYNLDYWKELADRHNKSTIMFHVASATAHLDAIEERDLPMLVSYYLLANKGILYRRIVLGEKE